MLASHIAFPNKGLAPEEMDHGFCFDSRSHHAAGTPAGR
jgi:hypothetical protein